MHSKQDSSYKQLLLSPLQQHKCAGHVSLGAAKEMDGGGGGGEVGERGFGRF